MSKILKNRAKTLDAYRGLAVALMIVFHFCWDLRDFGFLEYSLEAPFWIGFRYVILFLFLTAVGWSSYLAHISQQTHYRFCFNQFKILSAAVIISLGSFLAMPKQWIFFGILHFIFLSSMIIRPISGHALISTCLGGAIILLTYLLPIDSSVIRDWFSLTLGAPNYTLDYVSPFPWIGVVLIGPIFGYLKIEQIALAKSKVSTLLALMGRHALVIYLGHQLLLYPLVACVHFLISD